MQCTVIFEHGPTSVGAYVPDLPGCVAVGATREESHALITEAMIEHLAERHEDGLPVPVPTSTSAVITVSDAAA